MQYVSAHVTVKLSTGTSACDNGTFYCANKGFREQKISSTFVDDGVCDCCDGTDEVSGCNDSCQMLGELKRKDLQRKLDQYQFGAEARALLVPEAAKRRKEWAALMNELTPQVVDLKAQVAKLEGASFITLHISLPAFEILIACFLVSRYRTKWSKQVNTVTLLSCV